MDYQILKRSKMKVFLSLFALILFVISCGSSPQEQRTNIKTPDLTKVEKDSPVSKKDTTIIFDIEGISAEGTEAITKYIDGKISESTINVYGETGQATIRYVFLNDKINVTEKLYTYKAGLESVNSEKDMKLKKELSYVINRNGTPLGKADKDRLDVFPEFKKVVPFVLDTTNKP
jgi:hypothetical protein